ncbi:MAG TPA: TetR/AcrR family transcriptional regulator C-terminal domain-containing protein [Candidatus Limnocylindrales bacterium]|nr:TetR/AcrR family transcriptional regulator C-terminal domain-containing protein [Candidatus Limnocylindrales bacterium]
MAPRPNHVERPPLSRERVLRAAMGLADREGIESLTMRRLASEVGVEAMTLYYYVANKDEILAGIADLVATEIELPVPGSGWKTASRQLALATRDALVRHPWASALWMSPIGVGPGRLRHMDAGLRAFREAGFSAALTELGFHALQNHVLGYSLQKTSFTMEDADVAEAGAGFLERLPEAEYPFLAEHVRQHLEGTGHLDAGDFEFTLDLLLDGIERLRGEA